jgi:hypothetical protein
VKVNWKGVGKLAYAVVKIAVPAIQDVEDRARELKTAKGDAKKTAAIALVKQGMHTVEDVTGKDFVNDPEFDAVLGDLNDVLVRLNNLEAKKAAVFVPATAAELGTVHGSTGE